MNSWMALNKTIKIYEENYFTFKFVIIISSCAKRWNSRYAY
jgi:hypothetical protein